jgi:hypothetical protein
LEGLLAYHQGDQKIGKKLDQILEKYPNFWKFSQNFGKSAKILENQPKVWKISQNFGKSSQYINIKAHFETPKHLQKITF